jgi:hypothetical protein
VVPRAARKCRKCAKDIRGQQNRFEIVIRCHKEGSKGSSYHERNSTKNYLRRISMQIYGMQCIDPIGLEGDFRRINENGDAKENETHG